MGTVDQHPSSGNTHPVANLATPRAMADGIESGQGERKSSYSSAFSTPAHSDAEKEIHWRFTTWWQCSDKRSLS